jgi:3-hydroxyacyl-[acyl-carrier-protein] dehydratase
MKNNSDIFRDDLWTLSSFISQDNDSFKAVIRFNTLHRIFEVHFPGSPVVPGACIVQIATELLSHHLSCPMVLSEAKNIKFINLINPLQHNVAEFSFKLNRQEDEKTAATITVSDGDNVFVKISAQFRKS